MIPKNPEFEKLRREELSFEDFTVLPEECRRIGIRFIATPCDKAYADFLAGLKVDYFKIGSGELNYLSFLRHVAGKGRPIILSTGMSSLAMIRRALDTLKGGGASDIILLHCISAYPAALTEANIRTIDKLWDFGLPVGYSDHCREPHAAYAAAALGACMIEKHFTLSRYLPGDDHPMSVEPDELADLIEGIRAVESTMGTSRIEHFPAETTTCAVSRRGLYARHLLKAGTVLTEKT